MNPCHRPVPPILVAVIGACFAFGSVACSDDSTGPSTNLTPFAFLAGDYDVTASAGVANCAGETFFPKESWTVSTYLASVAVIPMPNTSVAAEPVSNASPADAQAVSQLPTTFTAIMGPTLHWLASVEDNSTDLSGCLRRRTTLLDVQFTPDGHLSGTRSVFHEYAGGTDCPADCRMAFDLEGTRRGQ